MLTDIEDEDDDLSSRWETSSINGKFERLITSSLVLPPYQDYSSISADLSGLLWCSKRYLSFGKQPDPAGTWLKAQVEAVETTIHALAPLEADFGRPLEVLQEGVLPLQAPSAPVKLESARKTTQAEAVETVSHSVAPSEADAVLSVPAKNESESNFGRPLVVLQEGIPPLQAPLAPLKLEPSLKITQVDAADAISHSVAPSEADFGRPLVVPPRKASLTGSPTGSDETSSKRRRWMLLSLLQTPTELFKPKRLANWDDPCGTSRESPSSASCTGSSQAETSSERSAGGSCRGHYRFRGAPRS
jgi:hypothetical protein